MPFQLMSRAEIVEAVTEQLTFDELVELHTATEDTRGDEQYIAAASKWFQQRRKKSHEHPRSRTA